MVVVVVVGLLLLLLLLVVVVLLTTDRRPTFDDLPPHPTQPMPPTDAEGLFWSDESRVEEEEEEAEEEAEEAAADSRSLLERSIHPSIRSIQLGRLDRPVSQSVSQSVGLLLRLLPSASGVMHESTGEVASYDTCMTSYIDLHR